MRRLRLLLLVADGAVNRTLSYQQGWPRHIAKDTRYDVEVLNLLGVSWIGRLRYLALRFKTYDAIVLMHSVFSNACALTGWAFDAVRRHHAPKVYFIGNEYKLMPEKMEFCDRLGVKLLVTQSHDFKVQTLYRERLKCAVIGLPNTGWDGEKFRPERERADRKIDLGYRSVASPLFLGHNERVEIKEAFEAAAGRHGLSTDFSLNPEDRLDEDGWAAFLNSCKGQIGTEAGGDYFELTDETRKKINAFLEDRPDASVSEIRGRFLGDYANSVPIRIVSSRNIEAAATKSVQLLLVGEYGGYFKPGVHYLPVKHDYSNLDEVIRQFKNPGLCDEICDRAFDMVRERLAFPVLLNRFDAALRLIV